MCNPKQGKNKSCDSWVFYVWKRPPRPDSHHAHTSQLCQIQPSLFSNPLIEYTPFPWVLGLERDLLNLWGIRRMHKKELDNNSNKMHSRTVKDYLSNMDTICSYKRKIMTGCKMWGTSRTEPNPPSSLGIEGCSISLLGWGCKQL